MTLPSPPPALPHQKQAARLGVFASITQRLCPGKGVIGRYGRTVDRDGAARSGGRP